MLPPLLLLRPDHEEVEDREDRAHLHEQRLRNLKKGDSIVTAGGIVGDVVHIRESGTEDGKQKSMDDHVTVKSGESRFIVERGRITRVSGTDGTSDPSK